VVDRTNKQTNKQKKLRGLTPFPVCSNDAIELLTNFLFVCLTFFWKRLGQIGLRCRHCAGVQIAARTKGAAYYSQTIEGIYQVGYSYKRKQQIWVS
jgi:hypothetical protein